MIAGKKMVEPLRAPPFLLEHRFAQIKDDLHGNCIEASYRWIRSRAWREPARILNGRLGSTRFRLASYLATNQHAERRDRTNVCMCHLDHLL
jgi:hypothetical protein